MAFKVEQMKRKVQMKRSVLALTLARFSICYQTAIWRGMSANFSFLHICLIVVSKVVFFFIQQHYHTQCAKINSAKPKFSVFTQSCSSHDSELMILNDLFGYHVPIACPGVVMMFSLLSSHNSVE